MMLIVGRTASGKDRLSTELEKLGLRPLRSYTTRRPRSTDEATHLFVTENEADVIPDHFIETVIDDHRYFCTKGQIAGKDTYIVDPNGVTDILEKCPDTDVMVVNLVAPRDKRRLHSLIRVVDLEKGRADFDRRDAAESPMFDRFEAASYPTALRHSRFGSRVKGFYIIQNPYTASEMRSIAATLAARFKAVIDNEAPVV